MPPQTPTELLTIDSFRGGENNTDPPSSLADDQCPTAENVEFFYSACGERRLGCGPLDITGSNLDDEAVMVYITQWPADNDVLNQQLFAISATPGTSVTVAYRDNLVWSEITDIDDPISTAAASVYHITTQPLNGLLFVAYRATGDPDRMHVWDGTTLRATGFTEPDPPTVANTAGAGTYSGTRYFRIRVAEIVSGTIVRMSEPSTSVTFSPAGNKDGAVISQPGSMPDEGETDWIVEASEDDSLYYQIATVPVATPTYTDNTAYATGYSSNTLSPQIGDYDNLPAAKYIATDGDRLVFGGHEFDETQMSQIGWTPVQNDPGYGNAERLPLDIDNTADLDNTAGGPIVGVTASDFGTWYAFKFNRIYRMMRTGDVSNAYDVICLSTSRGAVEGSMVRGYTEDGSSCIYFLDPLMGPSRVGSFGIQSIEGQRGTWGRVNLQASAVVSHGVFYPYKQQVHWWIAVDGADRPNMKLVLQVSELRPVASDAVGRGWSSVPVGDRIAEAVCSAVFTETVSIDGISSISERPFIGMTDPDFIQRCDVEDTDAGQAYTATIISRPFMLAGQLNLWGAMVASILAEANDDYSVQVSFIRDFGKEENAVTTDLAPAGSETQVFKFLDNLVMSEARAIQVKITDA